MKRKDYDKIAEIITAYRIIVNPELIHLKVMVKQLADYFSKENKYNKMSIIGDPENKWLNEMKFNRKQFFKDCGVRE